MSDLDKLTSNEKSLLAYTLTFCEANNGRLLYSLVAGSNTYGLRSDASDFDIKGVFVPPMARYLSLKSYTEVFKKSVPTLNAEIELWDLKKFLNYLSKSNLTAVEWSLQYNDSLYNLLYNKGFIDVAILDEFVSKKALAHSLKGLAFNCLESNKVRDLVLAVISMLKIEYLKDSYGLYPLKYKELREKVFVPSMIVEELDNLVKLKSSGTSKEYNKDDFSHTIDYLNSYLKKVDVSSLFPVQKDIIPSLFIDYLTVSFRNLIINSR